MPKRIYRAWTPGEEDRFPSWIASNQHLGWKEKARKYSVECKPRSEESLRTKLRLLAQAKRPPSQRTRKIQSQLRRMTSKRRCRDHQGDWRHTSPINNPVLSEHGFKDLGPPLQSVMQREPIYAFHAPHDHQTVRPTLLATPSAKILWDGGNAQCASIRARTVIPRIAGRVRGHEQPRTIDLLWQVAYHIAGRTRQ
ncbi:hypothetical protein BJX63DRAFT_417191 [Aspergillus granulosus]|uniref:Myb-like domain-containing protein n=1 Tax=Aspergillus granulosus TaxID=176169 RepID=A0ABR4GR26_9EURO